MNALIVTVTYRNMGYDSEQSKEELIALANACSIEVTKYANQNLDSISPSTFIGSGKILEIKNQLTDIDLVIFDEELSPLQIKNITDILDIEVTDRTDLILRIFEQRAQTKEAKLQVEIAKCRYMLPRLAGMQEHLSGQLGGSGFRGSGEKQIELDRRVIHHQLIQATKELEKIVKQRQTQRKQRKDKGNQVVALVGYTNSGKSSLLNTLCDNKEKHVLQKDMLFATLETATRKCKIENHTCLISDTVGFIDRLPHHLVQAFRSTLEEVKEADLLIHVIDSSNDQCTKQIETTNAVLKALDADTIPVIYAYNKVDKGGYAFIDPVDPHVFLSVKKDINIDALKKQIAHQLFKEYAVYELHIPYDKGSVYSYLEQHSNILDIQYGEKAMLITVEEHPSKIQPFLQYRLQH